MYKKLFDYNHSKYVDKIHETYEEEYKYFSRYQNLVQDLTQKKYIFVNDSRVRIPLIGQYIRIKETDQIRKIIFSDEEDKIFENNSFTLYSICDVENNDYMVDSLGECKCAWYEYSKTGSESCKDNIVEIEFIENVNLPYVLFLFFI